MTIAIGFQCNDGIVLCADSQQTRSGYIKTYAGKVSLHIYKDLMLAAAGAGDTDYIETATLQALGDFPDCASLDEVRETIEQRLLAFFDQHLARWAPFEAQPSVELLIAVAGKKIPHALFHYSGTSFYGTSAKAIGSGVLLADEMIGRYCFGNYGIYDLTNLAVYILSKVKRGVDGCGGFTDLLALRKGYDFAFLGTEAAEGLEKRFLAMERRADEKLVRALTAKRPSLPWLSEARGKAAEGG